MRVTIKSSGVAAAQTELSQAAKAARNIPPALKVGALDIARLMHESFEKERDPKGIKWVDIQDETKDAKARRRSTGTVAGHRRGERTFSAQERGIVTRQKMKKKGVQRNFQRFRAGGRILIDTGALKGSTYAQAHPRYIQFGFKKAYGMTHQLGDKDRNIPARPFAPAEMRAGKWVLMRAGPSQGVFFNLEQKIKKHITPKRAKQRGGITGRVRYGGRR